MHRPVNDPPSPDEDEPRRPPPPPVPPDQSPDVVPQEDPPKPGRDRGEPPLLARCVRVAVYAAGEREAARPRERGRGLAPIGARRGAGAG